VKYITLLMLIILSATTLCAEQAINPLEEVPQDNIIMLLEIVATSRQEIASLKSSSEEQQKQIVALENSERVTKSELLSEINVLVESQKNLSQSAERLQEKLIKAEQSIKRLRKKLSELNFKDKQQNMLIKQQATAIKVLQSALDEHKKNQGILLKQQSERIGLLEETLKASQVEFTGRVESVKSGVSETKAQLDTLGQGLGDKVKQLGYWLGLVALLGVLGIALGMIVRKKLASSSDQLEDNLSRMRTQMEEENVKLDSKLVELLQSQMKLVQEVPPVSATPAPPTEVEVDHTLPLRVGAEIIRLRQRFKALPEGTKGLKPLFKSLERLEDEFNQKGYELVDMLGQPFDDGLNVKARFIPSDDVEPGKDIISKIIKPQINFNGIAVQYAEIEVLTGGE